MIFTERVLLRKLILPKIVKIWIEMGEITLILESILNLIFYSFLKL